MDKLTPLPEKAGIYTTAFLIGCDPGFCHTFLPVQSFLPYNSATTMGIPVYIVKKHAF
jgi:hypothetical protein